MADYKKLSENRTFFPTIPLSENQHRPLRYSLILHISIKISGSRYKTLLISLNNRDSQKIYDTYEQDIPTFLIFNTCKRLSQSFLLLLTLNAFKTGTTRIFPQIKKWKVWRLRNEADRIVKKKEKK